MNIAFKALVGFLNHYNELLLECATMDDFENLVSAAMAFAELAKGNFEESGQNNVEKLMPAAKKLAEGVIEHAESLRQSNLQKEMLVN